MVRVRVPSVDFVWMVGLTFCSASAVSEFVRMVIVRPDWFGPFDGRCERLVIGVRQIVVHLSITEEQQQ